MTDEDKQVLQQRTDEQKLQLVYGKKAQDFEDDARFFGADFIEGLADHEVVNDPIARVSKREPVLGMLMALAHIYEAGTASQSRHELQAQTEMSQFAVQITTAASDRAAVIKSAVQECLLLESAYSSIILGRKEFDIEFQNDSGEFINYETTEQLELLPEEK